MASLGQPLQLKPLHMPLGMLLAQLLFGPETHGDCLCNATPTVEFFIVPTC
jgi:hypothetical protein